MMKSISALWRIVIAAAVSGVLLVVLMNELSQPVEAPTRAYSAEFTDVSGLMEGADVRVNGVRVGKVATRAMIRTCG